MLLNMCVFKFLKGIMGTKLILKLRNVFVQAAAAEELDERCFLSAQSMMSLKVSEHFQVVKLLGEGSYGKVMLAVHRKRGWCKI